MHCRGVVYRVISSTYVPEVDDEEAEAWGGCYEEAHYDVKAEDVTDTAEGQAFLAAWNAEVEAAERIRTLKKTVEERGTLIALVDGKPVTPPEQKVLFDSFTIYGTGERLIETETEFWYLVNNGMDGDCWSRNTVSTRGAGSYGWILKKEEV